MIVNEFVEITMIPEVQKRYESLGYFIPRYLSDDGNWKVRKGTKIFVNVKDLGEKSKIKVKVSCDSCGKEHDIHWADYLQSLRRYNFYYCNPCYSKILASNKQMEMKMTQSFYDWCLENDKFLIERWNYDRNEFKIDEISYGSKKKIYFKCENGYENHENLYVSLDVITRNSTKLECVACRSVGLNYPESLDYWSEKNTFSPYEITVGSETLVIWKCRDNKHGDYERNVLRSISYGFRCPMCVSERIESFLAEKIRIYLDFLGWNVLQERFGKLKCINSKTKRRLPYDFEIDNLKMIIECHGSQHYGFEHENWHTLSSKNNGTTPQEEFEYLQWKDEYKRQYALSQGYGYIAIPYTEDDQYQTYKTTIDNAIEDRIWQLNNQ